MKRDDLWRKKKVVGKLWKLKAHQSILQMTEKMGGGKKGGVKKKKSRARGVKKIGQTKGGR